MFLLGWDDLDKIDLRPILYMLVEETSNCFNCSITR